MLKPELFNRTVGILIKAYLNGTLRHGLCTACAVGNIVAANMGYNVTLRRTITNKDSLSWNNGTEFPHWDDVFCTLLTFSGKRQLTKPEAYDGIAQVQIDSTGYEWEDLALIEEAFESVPETHPDPGGAERMYKGLVAVVDVLCHIHGADSGVHREVVARFDEAKKELAL